MSIKLDVKIEYKEAEIEGFGIVKVRPLGAGEELQLSEIGELVGNLGEQIKGLDERKDNPTPEDEANIIELGKQISNATKKMVNIIVSCFSSDDPTVVEKLVASAPFAELRRIHSEILLNA